MASKSVVLSASQIETISGTAAYEASPTSPWWCNSSQSTRQPSAFPPRIVRSVGRGSKTVR
jgi:hypothetical protein